MSAEELRLLLVELCATILGRMAREAVPDVASDLAVMFAKTVTDTFPDVKRACCTSIELIATAAPSEVRTAIGVRRRMGGVERAGMPSSSRLGWGW